MPSNFASNFPNGAIVDSTGRMSPGPDGHYFFLALFNRTGGPGGLASPVSSANGITVASRRGIATRAPTGRTPAQGLTVSMRSR